MEPRTAVDRCLTRQHGVITRRQALAAGANASEITRAVRSGRWITLHRGVFVVAGAPLTCEATLMAACLATDGRASHESAGWLWGLLDRPPVRPTVTVSVRGRPGDDAMVVHRTRLLTPRRPGTLRHIPCTDAGRTIVDLAGVLAINRLDDAMDRALSRRLCDIARLESELGRAGHRRGVAQLRASLRSRGYSGTLAPSVLESRTRRLLDRAGVTSVVCEHVVGPYRLDFTLGPRLAVEVDGFAFHAHPEAMRRDLRRRNELRAAGWEILVYTWIDVTKEGDRVVAEVRDALRRHGVAA